MVYSNQFENNKLKKENFYLFEKVNIKINAYFIKYATRIIIRQTCKTFKATI